MFRDRDDRFWAGYVLGALQENLKAMEARIMAKFDELNQRIDGLETALTNERQQFLLKLQEIRDQLEGGLTPAQADQLKTRLDNAITRAEEVIQATDVLPENATPTTPEEPAPPQ